MFGYLEKRAEERRTEKATELQIREKQLEATKGESQAVTGGMLQMMTVMQEQFYYTREKEEKDRREWEEERRAQRDRDAQQQQQQMTALLGALINKLDK